MIRLVSQYLNNFEKRPLIGEGWSIRPILFLEIYSILSQLGQGFAKLCY